MAQPEFDVKIDGLDVLQRKLETFPLAVARRCFREAMTFAVRVWVDEMRARAPKLDKVKLSENPRYVRTPGYLSQHIGVRLTINRDLQASAQVGPGKSAYWGLFQELGRRAAAAGLKLPAWLGGRGRRSGEASAMAARPFVRPSFEARADDVINRFADSLTKIVAEEIQKHSSR